MKKTMIATVLTLALALLAGCAGTDVVLKYAPDAFQKIVGKYPDLVSDTANTDQYYVFTVDGETAVKISNDYAKTSEDVVIQTPLQPFVDAGLDVTKLTDGYKADDSNFYLTAEYGKGTGTKNNVKDALFESAKADRAKLSYHQTLDHYGIELTNGKFEWAKDYTTNDKDIVYVLFAKPLRDLGVDVNNIQGWIFMTADNPDGSKTDILVKPADLDAE